MPTLAVIPQIRLTFHKRNRLAAFAGCLLGGIVPIATYSVAHFEAMLAWSDIPTYLVAGGLVFSARTVYQWCNAAFGHWSKALGFCVLLEGVMVTSRIPCLPLVCLALLVAINACATACTLSLEARPSRSRAPAKAAGKTSHLRRVG